MVNGTDEPKRIFIDFRSHGTVYRLGLEKGKSEFTRENTLEFTISAYDVVGWKYDLALMPKNYQYQILRERVSLGNENNKGDQWFFKRQVKIKRGGFCSERLGRTFHKLNFDSRKIKILYPS